MYSRRCYDPVIVYETLGPTLPDGLAGAASVWALAQQCAQNVADVEAKVREVSGRRSMADSAPAGKCSTA